MANQEVQEELHAGVQLKRFTEIVQNGSGSPSKNAIANWFDALEEKGVHETFKTQYGATQRRVFKVQEYDIVKFILEKKENNWEIRAILDEVETHFDDLKKPATSAHPSITPDIEEVIRNIAEKKTEEMLEVKGEALLKDTLEKIRAEFGKALEAYNNNIQLPSGEDSEIKQIIKEELSNFQPSTPTITSGDISTARNRLQSEAEKEWNAKPFAEKRASIFSFTESPQKKFEFIQRYIETNIEKEFHDLEEKKQPVE